MAHTKSAKKRHRQSLERRATNRATKKSLRTQLKKVGDKVAASDAAGAKAEAQILTKKVDQAAQKGVIHRNTAARIKSRTSKRLKAAAQAAK
ncbi:MAG: 30S ribosomal protein S20 [Pirellulales bacterium]